ncbi:MAG: hypothetical protein QMD99_06835 [Rhizobiaceae bacterium]|nr:hypothetical protein [Rhizobiaceae bacterium]
MVEVIPVAEFHRRLNAQGVSGRQHFALRCPMCGTVQSATSLIRAGAGRLLDGIEHNGYPEPRHA